MSSTAASLGVAPRAKTRARGTSPRAPTNPAPSPGSKRRRVSLPAERLDVEVPRRLTNRPSAAAEESDAIAMDAANVPVVSAAEFHARLAAAAHPKALDAYAAFYSSWYARAPREIHHTRPNRALFARPPSPFFALRSRIPSPFPHRRTNCITTDPSAMVLPMDDHMVHRGHGVFDTAHLHRGHLHMLDRHLERFARSMASAKIPPPMSLEAMRAVILRTAAASGLRDAQVRYYASAGPGGFALSSAECVRSAFYCVVVKNRAGPDPTVGVSVVTSTVPIKPPAFATVKSVNYLPNALVVAEAAERGADYGVWRTERGDVGEGPSMNVAFVTRDGAFATPPFDAVLAGCTIARVCELVRSGAAAHLGVTRVEIREVSFEEAKDAREAMLVGSVIDCVPVVRWDGRDVGGGGEGPAAVVAGKPGPVGLALHAAIRSDFDTNDEERTRVPYETFEGDAGAR
jgi:4-amino-4-deoxychorismate lyase